MQKESQDGVYKDRVQQELAKIGIIGFNPETDAIRHATTSGPRYYYCGDGTIHWAGKHVAGQRTWGAPADIDLERFVGILESVDEFDIVSREAFNWYSGLDVEGVHDGLCWGIASIYGEDQAHTMSIDRWGLKSVPGIGDKLGARIRRRVDEKRNEE